MQDFSGALIKLLVIANSDWFIALFAPVVIGQSNKCTLVLAFQQSFKNCRNTLIVISPYDSIIS